MKLNLSRLMRPSHAKACVGMAGILGAIAMGMAHQGCAAFQNTCAETAATRASAAVLVDDASARLVEAEAIIVKISNTDIRDKALVALAGARAGLDAARSSLAGVKNACEAVDITAAFADFVAAWKVLAPYLSLLGGPSAGSQVKAPIVVGMGG